MAGSDCSGTQNRARADLTSDCGEVGPESWGTCALLQTCWFSTEDLGQIVRRLWVQKLL